MNIKECARRGAGASRCGWVLATRPKGYESHSGTQQLLAGGVSAYFVTPAGYFKYYYSTSPSTLQYSISAIPRLTATRKLLETRRSILQSTERDEENVKSRATFTLQFYNKSASLCWSIFL
ncbi:hypothetical protein E2C01_069484 [Portunus trituberculatus]|uniref:Uncharacterized protein n=1 Tax=Portunus trituberculatus TaxID=210409 RepID=A0A5B7HZN9_PORTR|nr:hypothetical protein [Portunus trituberculatus]